MESVQDTTPFEIDVAELMEHFKQEEMTRRPYSQEWYNAISARIGDATCRSLGFYVIPEDFVLSVVIPIYNEGKDTPPAD